MEVDKSGSEELELVDKVNRLTSNSFGNNSRADYEPVYGIMNQHAGFSRTKTKLDYIVKTSWIGIRREAIGRIDLSGEEAILRVKPQYEGEAISFGESYESEFGKPIRVVLDNGATGVSII